MSLLLNQPSKLCFRRPVLARSSPLHSNGFSSSSLQTPPSMMALKRTYFADYAHHFEKKVPPELVYNDIKDDDDIGTIGSSHGWVVTLKDDGILRLQDDLNPVASETDPKRISLPPLVTLPHCQTQIVTNVAMSSSSPEDDECVVAVKFLGPQLRFCRPALKNPEWTNIRIQNPCFFSSRVMFSETHDMFRIPGSGGHLIGSWGLHTPPKIDKLRFQNLPKLTKTKRKLLHSCFTSEHLVESRSTGETFLVKWYRRTPAKPIKGMATMITKALHVFKLDKKGNAVYTQDIGDLCIFLSKSEPFCVPASSFPQGLHSLQAMRSNHVYILDVDEFGLVELVDSSIASVNCTLKVPFYIPPQNIN
ncbi:unnamed protein product [Arabidopsis thaliana]|uniref:KIB1-4 beta-propeller domain-containing protein n=2 Tax=Arabidopsis thaliana TaxID=3702 RepID=Q9FK17_ARATH|nr:hypothetical protein (DUF295) [Arabidopsis thaliana]ABE66244.1 unknown [Arabidopsis thaliana]AED96328.1 hypothetical protein (DUF295) [Arabidopsis thaliana]BAB09786.1 unnamed protein product [Arabidopsis thaliana]|eukprot:NP_200136.1 hypothetical protein (DUF295) [Arabidopsis thaliana]